MNSWKNALIGGLAALVMAFGGVVWAQQSSRISKLEESDEKRWELTQQELQRLSAVEAKTDIILNQNERIIRMLERRK